MTTLDLDAIKARRSAIIRRGGPDSLNALSLRVAESAADVPALVAEVERLRRDDANLRAQINAASRAMANAQDEILEWIENGESGGIEARDLSELRSIASLSLLPDSAP